VPKPKLGIIGSGRLGTAIARQSSQAGYEVRIANSRGPESLKLMLSVLLPGVIAATIESVVTESEIIVLAMPLNQYESLNPSLFVDKIVIDAMNYWPPTEGEIAAFMDEDVTSSERIQQYLQGADVIKTLNHVAYNELEEQRLPAGDPDRRAMALVGESNRAKMLVAELVAAIGFDPVDLGELKNGKKFQPDTPLFNARYVANDL